MCAQCLLHLGQKRAVMEVWASTEEDPGYSHRSGGEVQKRQYLGHGSGEEWASLVAQLVKNPPAM